MQFVKRRHGLPSTPVDGAAAQNAADSTFFRALEAAGLVGCINTDEQLSTTYKQQLDFLAKCGTRP